MVDATAVQAGIVAPAEQDARERGRTLWLAGAALLAAVLAGVTPLGDPDLPEHLAVGEWIVRHGAVPRLEPFAWTRAGQPYFAYSWAAQLSYYGALRALGPLGLHLLHALVALAAVLAAAAFARGRRWSPGVAAAVGALNYAAMATVANQLRPEQLLFVVVPLAWALADAAARTARRLPVWLGHVAVGCAAANTHLFFPLTAAPLAMHCAAARAGERRRFLAPLLALAAGWLLSPYGLVWPQVYRLNFAPNLLLRRPPAILEMEPGFEAVWGVASAVVLAALLLALPWLRGRRHAPPRERLVEALAWAGGLMLFAFAYRLIAIWWLLSLPAVGAVVREAAAALRRRPRYRSATGAAVAVLLLLTGMPPWPRELRLEGGTLARTLPTPAAAAARPLADWLLCGTARGAAGRIFTSFNFGSYLTWRLPGYSVSIDGRTIYPDSVAREFAWGSMGRGAAHARTWASADLAIIPLWMAVNDALAGDSDWVRLAGSDAKAGHGATLWARRGWWGRWRAPSRSATCMRPEGITWERADAGGSR